MENIPINSMAPCALSCIYLKQIDNLQSDHELLNLATNCIITQYSYIEVLLTNIAMDHVYYLATKNQISPNFTFTNCHGDPILDYDWSNGGVMMLPDQDDDDKSYQYKKNMMIF